MKGSQGASIDTRASDGYLSRVLSRAGAIVKRAIDVAGAATVLVASSPILAAAAAAVRVTMGSPVLFSHQRPGLRGEPFVLYKLRTMKRVPGAEGDPKTDAARLTKLGEFLRKVSIDELPQLVNVLKGDMSLVGPRPLMMQYLPRYDAHQARRHDVKPGITGWAQVNGRNTLSWEEKFELDVWYVEHQSLWLDAKILAMTALRVIKPSGISAGQHATMPEFMGTPSH